MADLRSGVNPLFLRDEALREGLSQIAALQRRLAEAAAPVLAARGLGPADHRALFAIGQSPDIGMGALRARLGVSKQSLGRVITGLTDTGLVNQVQDGGDGRRRRLRLTAAGREVEAALWQSQRQVLAQAYRDAGAEAVEGFRTVLSGASTED